jgi:hypothetical protein
MPPSANSANGGKKISASEELTSAQLSSIIISMRRVTGKLAKLAAWQS